MGNRGKAPKKAELASVWKPTEKSVSGSVNNEPWPMLLGEVRQKLRIEALLGSGEWMLTVAWSEERVSRVTG